jgi:hypothetical protein
MQVVYVLKGKIIVGLHYGFLSRNVPTYTEQCEEETWSIFLAKAEIQTTYIVALPQSERPLVNMSVPSCSLSQYTVYFRSRYT